MKWITLISLVVIVTSILVSCNKENVDPFNIEGSYATMHSYWEIIFHSLDSATYIRREEADTINIVRRGENIFIPHLSSTLVPAGEEYYNPSLEGQRIFIPEWQQIGHEGFKTIALFQNEGQELRLTRRYEGAQNPLWAREFENTWQGHQIKD